MTWTHFHKGGIMKIFTILLMLIMATTPAAADVVFEDHFNDEALDPEWIISLVDARDWTYTETDSALTVTDI